MIEHAGYLLLIVAALAAPFKYPHLWRYLALRRQTRLVETLVESGATAPKDLTALLAITTATMSDTDDDSRQAPDG